METPQEVSELMRHLKMAGFKAKQNNGIISIKGKMDIVYKKDNDLDIEIVYRDLKLAYMERGDRTKIMLLKIDKIIKDTKEQKIVDYFILKIIEFDRKFEVWFSEDSFKIRY